MDINIYLESSLTTWSFRKTSIGYLLKPIDTIATDFDHAYSTRPAFSSMEQVSNPESVFLLLVVV